MRGREIIETEGGATDDELNDSESSDSQDESQLQGRKSLFTSTKAPIKSVKNRQRVLLLSSRGIIQRYRHLLNDLHTLLPHSKKEAKLDTKSKLFAINELAEISNCNNALFLEVRKHKDLYLWMSKTPNGPSVKFNVLNVHTMDELKMTGNCLKGSRPIISFDSSFNTPCMELIKEILTHTFSTPKTSRKIKPFIDHVMQFSNCDGKIWVRHFQIKISIGDNNKEEINLVEIGPRFVLSVIRVFDGSFGGKTLFENDEYVSPNTVRRDAKEAKSDRYDRRAGATKDYDLKMSQIKNLPRDEANDVFI